MSRLQLRHNSKDISRLDKEEEQMESLMLHRREHHRKPSRLALTALVLVLAGLVCATAAQANQMTLFTCHAPNGEAVGNAGWTIKRTPDEYMTASDTCGSSGSGSLHLELAANPIGYGNEAGIDWIFTAPAWATIAEYAMQVPDSYAYPVGGAGVGQAAIWANDESDPIYDYRNLAGGSWGQTTIQRTPPDIATGLTINTACDGERGGCPSGATIARLDISAIRLLLNDTTVPTISGLTGSLTSGASLRGMVNASFQATDKGPGIYSAWFAIDGKPQSRILLDSNNGWCKNLAQTTDGTRSFSHPTPCAETTSSDITLNTASMIDGQHAVQLNIDDASGNTTSAYDATVTTHNAPAVDIPPSIAGSASVGSTLTGTPGTFSAPEGAGKLSSVTSAWLRCNDQTGTHCSPIPTATGTTYTPTTADTGYYIVYQNTVSDNDGTTTTRSQPTPAITNQTKETTSATNSQPTNNATITPASSGPGSTTGASSANITANPNTPLTSGNANPWRITLNVTPRRVHRGTTITLSGRVTLRTPSGRLASIPDKLVYLRARAVHWTWTGHGHNRRKIHQYGKWIVFMRLLRTKPNGKFTGKYRFRLAGHYVYQFTAVAPKESGYPNNTGTSNTVTVNETH
jgi:hypothetical protein